MIFQARSLFVLALRNVSRSINKLRPMMVMIVLSFALLIAGNAVLDFASQSFYQLYSQNLTADMSVTSHNEEGSFNLFGSDAFLVGEFLVPATLLEFPSLQQAVNTHSSVIASAGVVSTAGRIEYGRRRTDRIVFGVDFPDYLSLFPDLEIVLGSVDENAQTGIMLQEAHHAALGSPEPGSRLLITAARGNTFTIREVPLLAVYRYPATDEALALVSLVDVQTARALSGYVYGALDPSELPEEHRGLADAELDDLFGGGDDFFDDDFAEEEAAGDLWAFDTAPGEEIVQARQTIEGAWNHLLVRLNSERDQARLVRSLEQQGFNEEAGYLFRDWRQTAGGTALLVWYLQLMLNAGLLFTSIGAVIVAINALMLSVFERQKEIGTMRALGARQMTVSALIIIETMLVVAGSALLGIVLGLAAVWGINEAGITIDNQYFEIMFSGQALQALVSSRLLLQHLLAALFFGLLAAMYPLRRALSIKPARAMA